MKRIHLLIALFVFGFIGLALASTTQATETPKDNPPACEKKASAEGCMKDADAATCKKDAAACSKKTNAEGVAAADTDCCEPGMACCTEDGKCCKHHSDAKPAADASGVVKVSDEATAHSCCETGSSCCATGSKCCAKAA